MTLISFSSRDTFIKANRGHSPGGQKGAHQGGNKGSRRGLTGKNHQWGNRRGGELTREAKGALRRGAARGLQEANLGATVGMNMGHTTEFAQQWDRSTHQG